MKTRSMLNLLVPVLYISFFSACMSRSKLVADMVLQNAQVYTVNKNQMKAEALAIKDGKIIFVGSNGNVKKLVGNNTEIIDCKGNFVMPGFIEGHGHIHGLGASLINLNLMYVKNWDEVVNMVAETVKKSKPGEWIIGRGWHQEKWSPTLSKKYLGYPYHDDLSRISPDNPVYLVHASGHAGFVNAKAMEISGINAQTKSPSGGEIVKDKNGVIIGVLEETAQSLVSKAYNEFLSRQSLEERKTAWEKSIGLAEQECLKKGVTSFQDAGSTFIQVEWMKQMAKQGKFNLRHWVMIRAANNDLRNNTKIFTGIKNEHNDFLTVRAIKVSLDGALGSYGAWLLEPYSDRAGWFGQPTFNTDSLKAIADFAWNNDLQLCVHAIGDRANREVINIYKQQIAGNKNKDHRWRVEHAQHVNPAEIPRFKESSVIASMQGVHCTSDAPFVPKRLGDKRSKEGAYVWNSFLKAGVVVNNGTDTPVEDVDPIACFYSSVTRKLNDGSEFYPAQKMTREQAIYSYTMANAFAAFQENEKGSLEEGKLADIVILSHNLISCKEEEIQKTKVMMTIVGGKVKYREAASF